MTAPALTWKEILAFRPCAEARDAVRKRLRAKFGDDYKTRALTIADAAEAGVELDGLIWIAAKAADGNPDCARRLRLFAADCAAHVSHLLTDPRSMAAIVAARQYARGEIGNAQLDAARDAAWAAVRAAARDAAEAAARDAAWAAAGAAARDAAEAAARDAAWDADRDWQRDRLAAWFSDNEPEDWPITDTRKEIAA